MTVVAYRLAGKASKADPSYIPSLIGHNPAGKSTDDDVYFEMEELPLSALAITTIKTTQWVNYDSLPLPKPDPIVAVRSEEHSYYALVSELAAAVKKDGSPATQRLIDVALKGFVR